MMEDRRQRFGAIRDSIQAAHGGNLSQEDMRREMGKLFGGMRGPGGRATPPVLKAPTPATGENRFGIIQRFPQFQKSVYTPARQAGRARVWILNAQKKLEPVFVRTGLTDGRFTEIISADLKPGDQIVMGATSNTESATELGRSPLTGQGQGQGQRQMGPGGPR
jgi:hypothetical protein